jgi:hypothetical protein
MTFSAIGSRRAASTRSQPESFASSINAMREKKLPYLNSNFSALKHKTSKSIKLVQRKAFKSERVF